MSAGPYVLSTYGGARQESTRACAVRFEQMLTALAAIHPAFARWNEKGYTEPEWNQPFCRMPPEIDELTRIFESGRHIADVSRKVMPELGYSVGAWNTSNDACGVSLYMNVGSYTEQRHFPNMIDMDFHGVEPGNADLINVACLKAILLTVVDAWEPNWASITTRDYRRRLLNGPVIPPFRSGWMTYLAAPYVQAIAPPPSAITERVAGGGILMLSTTDPFDSDNPAHVAAAGAIQECLAPLQANPRVAVPLRP